MDSRQRALDAAVTVISSGKIGGGVSIDHVPTLAQRFLDFLDPDPAEVGSQEMTALHREVGDLWAMLTAQRDVIEALKNDVRAISQQNSGGSSRKGSSRAPSTTETTPRDVVIADTGSDNRTGPVEPADF